MLGHLGVNVADLTAAKRYYDELMPLLGFTEFVSSDDEFAYRPAGGKPGTYLFFYPAAEPSAYSRHQTGLQHLAFVCKRRDLVDDVHRAVGELAARFGGGVVHAPREFPRLPAAVLRNLLARPVGLHVGSRLPLRPRLTDDRIRVDPARRVRISCVVRPHTDDSSGSWGRAD